VYITNYPNLLFVLRNHGGKLANGKLIAALIPGERKSFKVLVGRILRIIN
jgi:hypothetical protein